MAINPNKPSRRERIRMTELIGASAYMITLNEEQGIRAALESTSCFAEVVVVDSGSTDSTLDIVAEFENTRIIQREWPGFAAQKQFALEQCRFEWVVNIDADEVLTEAYVEAVRALVADGEYDALRGRRQLLRWGRKGRNFQKDDSLVRCFRKSAGRYDARRVHEGLIIQGATVDTPALIIHAENLTYEQRLAKSNRYSSLKALDKADNEDKVGFLTLLLIFPLSFIQSYVFKGHFLDGQQGLFNSMNVAFYNYSKYAKLAELYSDRAP